MNLSIIIVSWNVSEILKTCLLSIKENTKDLKYEIIVVDNASSDNTLLMLKEFKEIKIIENKENFGFGKACNQGLKIAQGDCVLFLNPDTLIKENAFKKLVDVLDKNQEIGFIGPKILNKDGSFQAACRRSIPNYKTAFFKLFGFSKLFPKSSVFAKYNMGDLPIDTETEVEAISGSCLMTRKFIADRLGGFDESFFMYGEDLDMCLRISNIGYSGYYYPQAEMIHYHKSSSSQKKIKSLFFFYFSAYLFYKKHFRNIFMEPLVVFFLLLKFIISLLKEGLILSRYFFIKRY